MLGSERAVSRRTGASPSLCNNKHDHETTTSSLAKTYLLANAQLRPSNLLLYDNYKLLSMFLFCVTRNTISKRGTRSMFSLLLTFCALAHLSSAALTSPLGPVVNLGYAAYVGNSTSPVGQANSAVTFFGGIPYAQAPIGDLRFRAPREH